MTPVLSGSTWSQQTTTPVADAFAGTGTTGAIGVAGAIALSVSTVASVAAVLPGSTLPVGAQPVVRQVEADPAPNRWLARAGRRLG